MVACSAQLQLLPAAGRAHLSGGSRGFQIPDDLRQFPDFWWARPIVSAFTRVRPAEASPRRTADSGPEATSRRLALPRSEGSSSTCRLASPFPHFTLEPITLILLACLLPSCSTLLKVASQLADLRGEAALGHQLASRASASAAQSESFPATGPTSCRPCLCFTDRPRATLLHAAAVSPRAFLCFCTFTKSG